MKNSLFLLLFVPSLLWAHGGGHPIRYVAEGGVDEGECGSANKPCASIGYAVGKSQKGDTVRVAAGRYPLTELDIFYLLSDMIKITGGYSLADGFKKVDAQSNLSIIEGVPAEYREALAKRGFQLQQDRKGVEGALAGREKEWLQLYKSITSKAAGPAPCENGKAENNDCHNIDRVSHMPLAEFSSSPSSANDIWGFADLNDNREYALIGLSNGTSVVDVTDAANPQEVGFIAGASSTWRDIKVYQFNNGSGYEAYAYVTTEGNQGLQVIDLNDLPNSVSLSSVIRDSFATAHNVYLANIDYASGEALEGLNAYLYVAGSNRDGGVFLTYDLSDPEAPSLVASGNRGYIHDGTSLVIDDERTAQCVDGHNPCELFVDFNENTVDIWDMTNKAAPARLSSTPYSQSGYTHSGWWSSDKQTIFIQDELDEMNFGFNTRMRALDIRDLSNPSIRGEFEGSTRAIDHNGFTLGDYYYMSNYRRGLTVIDVSDVENMQEVAFFDTFAIPEANIASFNGAWGAYPYLPSGNILVSDIEYGLWVLRLNENDGPLRNPDPQPQPSTPSSATGGSGGGANSAIILLALLGLAVSRCRVRRRQIL